MPGSRLAPAIVAAAALHAVALALVAGVGPAGVPNPVTSPKLLHNPSPDFAIDLQSAHPGDAQMQAPLAATAVGSREAHTRTPMPSVPGSYGDSPTNALNGPPSILT